MRKIILLSSLVVLAACSSEIRAPGPVSTTLLSDFDGCKVYLTQYKSGDFVKEVVYEKCVPLKPIPDAVAVVEEKPVSSSTDGNSIPDWDLSKAKK